MTYRILLKSRIRCSILMPGVWCSRCPSQFHVERTDQSVFSKQNWNFNMLDKLELKILICWAFGFICSYRECDIWNSDEKSFNWIVSLQNHCLKWISWFVSDFHWFSLYKLYPMHTLCTLYILHTLYAIHIVYIVYHCLWLPIIVYHWSLERRNNSATNRM